eukprot:CAMPEP_0172719248 /NCGR_PEP_ID=MMETSP1074-20121228/75398_1 /TAXON_ID=2916 /ORGANISM="Ceratium fusus, Strain PA161109" /LENGTH=389 /DNA_ID=CAMNT_0013544583 /DNA_START=145 /DNA_END=1314 /DNA_ORIENTATION=-
MLLTPDSGTQADDDEDAMNRMVSTFGLKAKTADPSGQKKKSKKTSSAMEFDIPEDIYGASMLALAKDLTDLVSGEAVSILTIVRFTFPLVLLAVNLALQFLCLFYINKYVVAASVHHVQETYARFHRNVFQADGKWDETTWLRYDDQAKDNLCQIAMTNQSFYYTALLIWIVSSLHEFRAGQQLLGNIMRVPTAESFGDQLLFDDVDEVKVYITALKPVVRCLMICLVVLPKIVISVALMGLGMRWLSATTSFHELIMNAVAMTFVTQIDELLYHFALPSSYRTQVADIDFSIQDVTPEEIEREAWLSYVRSAFYCVLSIVLVPIYAEIIQDILPSTVYHLVSNCREWQEQHTSLKCHTTFQEAMQKLFTEGLGNATEVPPSCYPFGRG